MFVTQHLRASPGCSVHTGLSATTCPSSSSVNCCVLDHRFQSLPNVQLTWPLPWEVVERLLPPEQKQVLPLTGGRPCGGPLRADAAPPGPSLGHHVDGDAGGVQWPGVVAVVPRRPQRGARPLSGTADQLLPNTADARAPLPAAAGARLPVLLLSATAPPGGGGGGFWSAQHISPPSFFSVFGELHPKSS